MALAACGRPPVHHETASTYGNNEAAVCIKYGSNVWDKREIVVFDDFWSTATDLEKAALMQHEEGHCKYDFSHDPKLDLDDECPGSLMSMYLPPDYCLQTHGAYYQADMAAKYAAKLVSDPSTPLVRSDDVSLDESVISMF